MTEPTPPPGKPNMRPRPRPDTYEGEVHWNAIPFWGRVAIVAVVLLLTGLGVWTFVGWAIVAPREFVTTFGVLAILIVGAVGIVKTIERTDA